MAAARQEANTQARPWGENGPTPQEVCEEGTKFCVGTPDDCIRFLEMYEALGIEEVFLLCAIGPAEHQEVLHTLRLFGEEVIPHFQKKSARN